MAANETAATIRSVDFAYLKWAAAFSRWGRAWYEAVQGDPRALRDSWRIIEDAGKEARAYAKAAQVARGRRRKVAG